MGLGSQYSPLACSTHLASVSFPYHRCYLPSGLNIQADPEDLFFWLLLLLLFEGDQPKPYICIYIYIYISIFFKHTHNDIQQTGKPWFGVQNQDIAMVTTWVTGDSPSLNTMNG